MNKHAPLQALIVPGSQVKPMLELITTFTPADGSTPRTITLRIGDVRPVG